MGAESEARSPIREVRLESLTGLRFVAALAVFGVHAGGEFWPGNGSVARAASPGVSGVTFFFILSGFVLAWAYRRELPFRQFYRRRAARILPLYYVALVLALVLHVRVGGGQFLRDAAPSFGLLQSWFPRQPVYFGGNGPGWSLSCEAFFYALLPVIAVGLVKRSSRLLWAAIALCVLATVGLALLLHPHSTDSPSYWAIYVLPLTRVSEFVAGVGLGLAMRRGWRSPVPLTVASALALGCYAALGWAPTYLLPAAAMFVPYLLLISSAATADLSAKGSVLRGRWMVRLGGLSFAFYLIHQSVITFTVDNMARFQLGSADRVAAMLFALGTSVGASAALYSWFEMPLERWLRSPRRGVAPLGGTGGVAATGSPPPAIVGAPVVVPHATADRPTGAAETAGAGVAT